MSWSESTRSVCVPPAGLWVVMASVSVSSGLNKTLRQHYLSLPQRGLCQVTYVWVDGSGEGLRNKTRTLDREPQGLEGKHSVYSPVWTGFTVWLKYLKMCLESIGR